MKLSLEKANQYARLSCTKFNKNRFSRKLNRARYRRLVNVFMKTSEHERRTLMYFSGNHAINTYPWPYRDNDFAN